MIRALTITTALLAATAASLAALVWAVLVWADQMEDQ